MNQPCEAAFRAYKPEQRAQRMPVLDYGHLHIVAKWLDSSLQLTHASFEDGYDDDDPDEISFSPRFMLSLQGTHETLGITVRHQGYTIQWRWREESQLTHEEREAMRVDRNGFFVPGFTRQTSRCTEFDRLLLFIKDEEQRAAASSPYDARNEQPFGFRLFG